MFGAGALVGLLPVLAITWAGPSRFGRGPAGTDEETYAPRFFWIPKVMFWLFLTSGLIVVMTMLLSMLPLFGTHGLHVLLDIHRYAGLLAVVVLVVHFYCVLLQRARLR
jgi:cytochrome b subunit of formate dehydrogenase